MPVLDGELLDAIDFAIVSVMKSGDLFRPPSASLKVLSRLVKYDDSVHVEGQTYGSLSWEDNGERFTLKLPSAALLTTCIAGTFHYAFTGALEVDIEILEGEVGLTREGEIFVANDTRAVVNHKRYRFIERGWIPDETAEPSVSPRVSTRMVPITGGGEFWMGCSPCKPGDTGYVTAPPFSIDATEVTVSEYERCRKTGCCPTTERGGSCNWDAPGREGHPINCVTHGQAEAYCAWARKRLPTEVEWHRAARGPDGRTYPWGNEDFDPDHKQANIRTEGTVEIGTFPKDTTVEGVSDMAGNVAEWVTPDKDRGRGCDLRGAAWDYKPLSASTWSQECSAVGAPGWNMNIGFRCAK